MGQQRPSSSAITYYDSAAYTHTRTKDRKIEWTHNLFHSLLLLLLLVLLPAGRRRERCQWGKPLTANTGNSAASLTHKLMGSPLRYTVTTFTCNKHQLRRTITSFWSITRTFFFLPPRIKCNKCNKKKFKNSALHPNCVYDKI